MKRRRRWAEPRPRTGPALQRPAVGFGPKDWAASLGNFTPKEDDTRRAGAAAYFDGWWEKAFKDRPTQSEERGHPCGENEMLTIVAYDIREPARLRNIAKHCEDYGVRVQYSVFECRLQIGEFDRFWEELKDLIDPREDRLVSYRICCRCAQDIRTAGVQEVTPDAKPVAYVF
jgi:CRISPR-associated protein Cas2